jgi:hypothetical protein
MHPQKLGTAVPQHDRACHGSTHVVGLVHNSTIVSISEGLPFDLLKGSFEDLANRDAHETVGVRCRMANIHPVGSLFPSLSRHLNHIKARPCDIHPNLTHLRPQAAHLFFYV